MMPIKSISNCRWRGHSMLQLLLRSSKAVPVFRKCVVSFSTLDLPTWMNDRHSPELSQFIKKENRYTAQVLRKSSGIQKTLYREMRETFMDTQYSDTSSSSSIPEYSRGYAYYIKHPPGANYPIYCRYKIIDGGETQEQILLDQNQFMDQYDSMMMVGNLKVSPNERYVAYTLDTTGSENYELFIRDLESAEDRRLVYHSVRDAPDHPHVIGFDWDPTSGGIYYSIPDTCRRPFQVYHRPLSSWDSSREPTLVFEERDPKYFIDISLSKDQALVFLSSQSKRSSEIHIVQSSGSVVQCIQRRESGVVYFVEKHHQELIIVTNVEGASNYKVMRASLNDVSHWHSWIPASDAIKIEDVDVLEGHCILYQKHDGCPEIRICALNDHYDDDDSRHSPVLVPIPPKHQLGVISPGVNKDPAASRVRFSISTPFVPEIIYDYDVHLKTLTCLYERPVVMPGRFVPSEYTCTRVHVPTNAVDSLTKEEPQPMEDIPMTLMYHQSSVQEQHDRRDPRPTLVLAYGAYGTNVDPDFQVSHLSLLKRGWIIALAHVRGGGELGLRWHKAGSQEHKRQSFADFRSCLEYLVTKGYTSPEWICAQGTSAGGMILGVAVNEFPHLLRAVVLKVPFVDVWDTMSNPALPLTIHEYEEWGNPTDETGASIQTYCPVQNRIRLPTDKNKAPTSPAMYITASLEDQRVPYAGVLKYFYRSRQIVSSKHHILLNMSESDSHFGSGGRLDELYQTSVEYAFLHQALGLDTNVRQNKHPPR